MTTAYTLLCELASFVYKNGLWDSLNFSPIDSLVRFCLEKLFSQIITSLELGLSSWSRRRSRSKVLDAVLTLQEAGKCRIVLLVPVSAAYRDGLESKGRD